MYYAITFHITINEVFLVRVPVYQNQSVQLVVQFPKGFGTLHPSLLRLQLFLQLFIQYRPIPTVAISHGVRMKGVKLIAKPDQMARWPASNP